MPEHSSTLNSSSDRIRFFYLRNQANFPVTCVAFRLVDSEKIRDNPGLLFAYSTYNLHNEPKPYTKIEAKVKAAGRLNSSRFQHWLPIEPDWNFERVQAAICEHIVACPHVDAVLKTRSVTAIEAAQRWLVGYTNRQLAARTIPVESYSNPALDDDESQDEPRAGQTVCEHGRSPFDCQVCYPPGSRRDDLGDLQAIPGSLLTDEASIHVIYEKAEDSARLDRIFGSPQPDPDPKYPKKGTISTAPWGIHTGDGLIEIG